MAEGKGTPTSKQQTAPRQSKPWTLREFWGKTVWNWMQLLGVLAIPVVLAGAGIYFETQQDVRQRRSDNKRAQQAQEIENQRAAAERAIQQQNAQDEALQAYLDQMTNLLLERNLRDAEENSEARTLARARTLTVLGRVSPSRKREVISFLTEADLVNSENERGPIIALEGANLANTNLINTNLRGADLSGADLSGANLSGADLSGANLSDADLTENLLIKADLGNAILDDANLNGAVFTGARGVGDLSVLTSARASRDPSLRGQVRHIPSVDEATLPDGTRRGPSNPTLVHVEPDSVIASAAGEATPDGCGVWATYEPENALDTDASTAWNVYGSEVREWIKLKYNKPVSVRRLGIIPGYDKVDLCDSTYRFYQQLVIRTAEIRFSDGSTVKANFARSPRMQFTKMPKTKTNSITITILDTYPPGDSPMGEDYPFTAVRAGISEITVEGPSKRGSDMESNIEY